MYSHDHPSHVSLKGLSYVDDTLIECTLTQFIRLSERLSMDFIRSVACVPELGSHKTPSCWMTFYYVVTLANNVVSYYISNEVHNVIF